MNESSVNHVDDHPPSPDVPDHSLDQIQAADQNHAMILIQLSIQIRS